MVTGYFAGKEILHNKETTPHEEFLNHQKQIATYAAKYAWLEEFITSTAKETDSYQPSQKLAEQIFIYNAQFRNIYESYLSWSEEAAGLLDNNDKLRLGLKQTVDLVLETHKKIAAQGNLKQLMGAEMVKEQEKHKENPQKMAQIKSYYDLISLEQIITDEVRQAGDIFLAKFNHIQI